MLPAGWRLRLDPATRRTDDGTVLIGGAPFRLLRLSPAGTRALDELLAGAPIGDSGGRQQLARRLLDAGMAHPEPDAATLGPDDVTVVVPVWPDARDLPVTLAAIGPAGEVVVVDDAAPGHDIAEVAAAHGARSERRTENGGPAAARNTGWRLAATEVLAFIDPSCVPDAGWIERLLPLFDDPQVAAVAPRITTRIEPGLPPALAAYERARPSLDRGPADAVVRPGSRVPFVPTTALLVRRAALEAVGGFDEALRVGEDVDLVWRLVEAGWTVRYDPSVEVAHASRRSTTAWLRQRHLYGTSAAGLATRHGRAVAPVSVSPWTAAAWSLSAAGAPVLGAAVAAGSSAALAPKLRNLQHPWREAFRLAGIGHLYAGRTIAEAVRRPWWPFALGAALVSRRARRAVVAAAVVPPLVEWVRERPPLDPVRWTALRLADDVAYGAGVWKGCLDARSGAALAPDLQDWPGRRPAVERAEARPSRDQL